ncbi:MAG: YitT family protein [Lactobacillales bacterium]|jgi:uncharacterized membrane-anchored protein YitT (DUF2179 family)|nr:YitT family protein [Lactobacillales bacterium]
MKLEYIKKAGIVVFASLCITIGVNWFLTPSHLVATGVTGFGQLSITVIHNLTGVELPIGLFVFVYNLPIIYLAWKKLGKSLVLWTIATVLALTVFGIFIPVMQVVHDEMLNAIIGGVLVGLGTACALAYGFTSGGVDVVSMVVSRTTGKSIGKAVMALNAILLVFTFFVYNVESVLLTVFSLFCMSVFIDYMYKNEKKVTMFIVSSKSDAIVAYFRKNLIRGMTIIPAQGGYTQEKKDLIMIVLTRVELFSLESLVYELDPDAFINVVATQTIFGRFANEQEQKLGLQTGVFPELARRKIDE